MMLHERYAASPLLWDTGDHPKTPLPSRDYRRSRMRYFFAVMLTAAACATGCSPSGATNPPVNAPKAAGQSCYADSECETGLKCLGWGVSSPICSKICSKTADCQSGDVCVTPPDSMESYCVPTCTAPTVFYDGVCVNGVPTPCEAVPLGSYCSECEFTPCPQGQRCDKASDRCVELPGVGSPCSVNSDCASNNCGTLPGANGSQCFVNAGSECTAQNCGSCDTVAGGAGCAQSCTQDTDCPVLDYAGSCHPLPQTNIGKRYYPCIGTPAGGYFCRRPCDGVNSACPPGLSCARYTPGQCSDYLLPDACQ
jgi:hypothetical protein